MKTEWYNRSVKAKHVGKGVTSTIFYRIRGPLGKSKHGRNTCMFLYSPLWRPHFPRRSGWILSTSQLVRPRSFFVDFWKCVDEWITGEWRRVWKRSATNCQERPRKGLLAPKKGSQTESGGTFSEKGSQTESGGLVATVLHDFLHRSRKWQREPLRQALGRVSAKRLGIASPLIAKTSEEVREQE